MTLTIERVRDRIHLASRLAHSEFSEVSGEETMIEEAAGKKKPAAKSKKETKDAIEKIGKRQVRTLSVFADGDAMKLIQRLYTGYVSATDAGGFTTFMHDLDALMTEHRDHSNDPVNLEPEDEEEDGEGEQELDDEGNPIENDGNNADDEDEDGYNGMSEKQLKAIDRRRKEREMERMAEGKTKK